MSDVELMTTNGHSHYHEEEEEEPVGERNCRSPTEGTYGDDEMKENEEERKTTKRRVKKTVSIGGVDDSDDEKPRSRAKARTLSGRTMSSSEDESKPRKKVSLSKMSVRERQMSFEHPPDRVEHRPPRRNSRHGSTTASDVDDYHHQTAADRRNRWEKQASKDILGERRGSKAKVHGGSTGAATLKERFENKAVESKKPVTSSHRNFGAHLHDSTDGGEERHSAHSLKARFEAKIKDNAPVKRNFVINRGGSGAAKKFGGGAPTSNKCQVCTKTVYPMEKLEADGNVYHKFCFKCKTCGRTVGLGSYAALAGDIYCKPHLKQLFKLKGNYDEGFGREQRKADWVKKDPNAKPSQASTQAVDAEPAQEVEPEAETED